jgi:hypothetical protein
MASAVTTSVVSAQEAKKPTISDATVNLLEGEMFNLNINNKVKGSKYEWKTSNKKIATVEGNGYVTGVAKGNVTITCIVTVDKNTKYTLTSKVKVIVPAKKIAINNKVSIVNVGQKYNLNRTLTPSTSNDVTTWTTNNKLIAVPATNGVFTALKEGSVRITATTVSGAKDNVTIKVVDEAGTVSTQEELNELLGSGVQTITIETTQALTFDIPAGNYKKTTLVINAVNATVNNKGTFKNVITGVATNPTPSPSIPGGSTGGGTGGNTGGTVPGPGVEVVVEKNVIGDTTYFQLPAQISQLDKVVVSYGAADINVGPEVLATLDAFLENETKSVETWLNTTNTTKTVGGFTTKVTGTAGSTEKTVEYGSLTYKVDVNSSSKEVSVTTTAGKTYVIKKLGLALAIEGAPSSLQFKVTH